MRRLRKRVVKERFGGMRAEAETIKRMRGNNEERDMGKERREKK